MERCAHRPVPGVLVCRAPDLRCQLHQRDSRPGGGGGEVGHLPARRRRALRPDSNPDSSGSDRDGALPEAGLSTEDELGYQPAKNDPHPPLRSRHAAAGGGSLSLSLCLFLCARGKLPTRASSTEGTLPTFANCRVSSSLRSGPQLLLHAFAPQVK